MSMNVPHWFMGGKRQVKDSRNREREREKGERIQESKMCKRGIACKTLTCFGLDRLLRGRFDLRLHNEGGD